MARAELKDIRPPDRDVELVRWPGEDRKVGLLLLRCQELQDAHFAAVDHFKRKLQPTDGVSLGEFLREKERQEVFRMLLQPGSKRPEDRLFANVDSLRRDLDIEEVAHFQREHERLTQARLQRLGLLPPPEAGQS